MRQLNNTQKEITMRKDTTLRILLNENSEYRDRSARRRWKDKPD